jgi:uncharacterized membrane protein YkvA (DUF1232 family)
MENKKKRAQVPPPPGRFGPLEQVVEQVRLALALLGDNRVRWWHKLIPLGAIAYAISPLDMLPAILFLFLGVLDDIAILALAVISFNSLAPEAVVVEHLRRLRFGKTHRVRRERDGIVIEVQAESVEDADEPSAQQSTPRQEASRNSAKQHANPRHPNDRQGRP